MICIPSASCTNWRRRTGTEGEAAADFWYIGFARRDAPYGHVLSLSERYFAQEEAVAMARGIRFTEAAWAAADSASP